MTFFVGQKVARFDGDVPPWAVYPCPALHEPVTVANVFTSENSRLHIELVEYPMPETETHYAGFIAEWFRPITTRKTDISIFTEMLTPNGVKQNERV